VNWFSPLFNQKLLKDKKIVATPVIHGAKNTLSASEAMPLAACVKNWD